MYDKNGEMIFEDDIIKCFDGHTAVVKYDKTSASFVGYAGNSNEYYLGVREVEVIGNIWDNPGLLEVKE